MGSWATTGIENDPGVSQLDVAGIFRLDHFPAKNSDVEVLRFFLIPHGEEMRDEEAFVCNRRVRQIHAVPPVVDNRMRPESPGFKGSHSLAGDPPCSQSRPSPDKRPSSDVWIPGDKPTSPGLIPAYKADTCGWQVFSTKCRHHVQIPP